MKNNKVTAIRQARKLYEDFIGLADDSNANCEENAIEIAIICARHLKNNAKNEDKTYWLDVVQVLKSESFKYDYED